MGKEKKEIVYVLQQDYNDVGPKGTHLTFKENGSVHIYIPDDLYDEFKTKKGTTVIHHKGFWEEGCSKCGEGREWHAPWTSEYTNWFTPKIYPDEVAFLRFKRDDPTYLLQLD